MGPSVVLVVRSLVSVCLEPVPVPVPDVSERMVFSVDRWLPRLAAPRKTRMWRWVSCVVLPVGVRARRMAWDRRWCR